MLEAEGFEVVGEAVDGATAVTEAAAGPRPRAARRDAARHRRLRRLRAAVLVGRGRPAVVLTSSRDAAAYADRLTTTSARGFVPKEELSGAVLLSFGGTR